MILAHNDFMVAHIDFRVAHIDFVVVHNDPGSKVHCPITTFTQFEDSNTQMKSSATN